MPRLRHSLNGRTSRGLGLRIVLALWMVLSLVQTLTGDDPRWEKTGYTTVALAALAGALLPVRRWRTLKVLVGAAAALLLALSGAVSGVSIDEGFGLIAIAFLLSGIAWVLGQPEQRAASRRADETLHLLTQIQAELAALRAERESRTARPRPA